MTTQNTHRTITVAAAGDISALQFRPVNASGALAITSAAAVGILQNKPAAAGRAATVAIDGVLKSYAGGAIAKGVSVGVTTSGWLVTTTSDSSVGKALDAAASGDLFRFTGTFAGQN